MLVRLKHRYQIDRQHLQQLEERAHDHTRNKRTHKPHFGVRNTDIHDGKQQPADHKLQKLRAACMEEMMKRLHMHCALDGRMNEDIDTALQTISTGISTTIAI